MRILALSNLYPPDILGGYELACKQAVDALRARGHETRVLTAAPRTTSPEVSGARRVFRLHDVFDEALAAGSHRVTNVLRMGQATLIDAVNVHALIREVGEFQPDVAYLHSLIGIGGLGLVAALQALGVPWVWHLMDDVPTGLCLAKWGVLSRTGYERLVAEFQRQARGAYLACSQGTIDEIEAQGFHLTGSVETISNWVTRRGPATRAPGDYLPGGVLRMVTAGALNPAKGIDIAIRAAELLRARGHGAFRLDIYGMGNDNSYRQMIQAAGLSSHVALKGPRPQSELLELYANYDVFVFPTWAREPYGMAPLEAAACGCVPLMSWRCGVAEWFVDGAHCLKAARSPEAFAAAMASILEGRVDVAGIGRRAAALANGAYHIDAILPRIESALARQAARRRSPSRPVEEIQRQAVLAEKLMICQLQGEPAEGAPGPYSWSPEGRDMRAPDLHFHHQGVEGARGRARWLVPLRRGLRRVLRPFFQAQINLYQRLFENDAHLCDRLDQLEGRSSDFRALARRLAELEDRLIDSQVDSPPNMSRHPAHDVPPPARASAAAPRLVAPREVDGASA